MSSESTSQSIIEEALATLSGTKPHKQKKAKSQKKQAGKKQKVKVEAGVSNASRKQNDKVDPVVSGNESIAMEADQSSIDRPSSVGDSTAASSVQPQENAVTPAEQSELGSTEGEQMSTVETSETIDAIVEQEQVSSATANEGAQADDGEVVGSAAGSKEDSLGVSEQPADSGAENEVTKEKSSKPSASDTLFSDLELSREVQLAVQANGYIKPTAIQAEIIPHMLAGRDVLAQSQTGTGKTAAFALPVLSRIDTSKRESQVLVLAPTRELAGQVAKSFEKYGQEIPGFTIAAIYGGQDYEPQLRKLKRGAHVVVATPGRLIDHLKRGTLKLDTIRCLVLDEADEMLNMGFHEDVQFVLQHVPEQRQIALFSATVPEAIRVIAENYLNDPARVKIKRKTNTAESIRQRAVFMSPRDKVDTLVRFLEAEETDGVIVFTKTRETTVVVAEKLLGEGFQAVALNGDMPQSVRERTISNMKSGKLDVLVATDVAARGLDITRVSHVFNFDLPHDSESYIHRVGRTGRAGRAGEAIIFLTGSQRRKLELIERATKQRIEVVQPPTIDDINSQRIERFKNSITQVIADKDLTFFKKLLTKYSEQNDTPMEMIAAALAEISQRGRPFLLKERPKSHYDEEHRGRERERRGSRDGDRGPRKFKRPESGMQRYRVAVGSRQGVRPGNLVGAIANEAGLSGSRIGPIYIYENYSTVDLPDGMTNETFEKLKKAWVGGKQLDIQRASSRGEGGRPRGPRENGRGFSKGGGRGKFNARPKGKGPSSYKKGRRAK